MAANVVANKGLRDLGFLGFRDIYLLGTVEIELSPIMPLGERECSSDKTVQ